MGFKLSLLAGFLSFSGVVSAQQLAEIRWVDSVSISFDSGNSTVKNPSDFSNRINHLKLPCMKFKLIAYTDTVGSFSYNKVLASKRMAAVLKLIDSSGIKTYLVDTLNRNEEGNRRRDNDASYRRVDVLVYEIIPAMKYNAPINLLINFHSGTSNIVKESMENVKLLEMLMKHDTTFHIKLNGHVCCQPDLILSQHRAEKVKLYLTNHGINGKRVVCNGYSNTVPLVPEISDKNQNRNMRVEVVFIKSGKR